jgi:hypothetical protein
MNKMRVNIGIKNEPAKHRYNKNSKIYLSLPDKLTEKYAPVK